MDVNKENLVIALDKACVASSVNCDSIDCNQEIVYCLNVIVIAIQNLE